MANHGIDCQLRVITDYPTASKFHDRWILSKNANFNIPSPDVAARGQYSEVKRTENKLPFNDLWKNAKDIISDWSIIEPEIKAYQNRRFGR